MSLCSRDYLRKSYQSQKIQLKPKRMRRIAVGSINSPQPRSTYLKSKPTMTIQEIGTLLLTRYTHTDIESASSLILPNDRRWTVKHYNSEHGQVSPRHPQPHLKPYRRSPLLIPFLLSSSSEPDFPTPLHNHERKGKQSKRRKTTPIFRYTPPTPRTTTSTHYLT